MGFREVSHFLKEANVPGLSQCCASKCIIFIYIHVSVNVKYETCKCKTAFLFNAMYNSVIVHVKKKLYNFRQFNKTMIYI